MEGTKRRDFETKTLLSLLSLLFYQHKTYHLDPEVRDWYVWGKRAKCSWLNISFIN